MEYISIALKALFSQQDGDEILHAMRFFDEHTMQFHNKKDSTPDLVHLDSDISESVMMSLLQKEDDATYSNDQLSMVGQVVLSKWMVEDRSCLPLKFHNGDSIFNILLHFASKTLLIKDGNPVCKYGRLLRWHSLTTNLGEDLFTTAMLASWNVETGCKRNYFDWPAFLQHDCKEINALFDKPMADIHMHLKGSSYNVDISWLCLMNNIEDMSQRFKEIGKRRESTGWDDHLYEKIRRAAAIRLYLAGIAGCVTNTMTKSQLVDIINNKSVFNELQKNLKDQDLYDKEKEIYSLLKDAPSLKQLLDESHSNSVKEALKYGIEEAYVLDYISVEHRVGEPVTNLVMASERKLLYNIFLKIYSGKNQQEDKDTATLLYAYLVYKDMFRHTILQLNKRVGFANFVQYEELKTEFILPKYDKLIYKAAIEGFVNKNFKNRFVEARIAPKSTPEDLTKTLEDIYSSIDGTVQNNCSIILHFIKKRDESFQSNANIRHNALRNDIKQQAQAIYKFRQNSKENGNFIGRVVGIDAANSEIYARPEVFAQAFRFLRGHEIFGTDKDRPDDLNITYHVGEDFLDIADGLRAVDEALIFLGLKNGDRIGHALVLGTDVRTYYKKRYDTIVESKQVILDNMAWLYHKCIRLKGFSPICGFFETMFHHYFRDVFNWNPKDDDDKDVELLTNEDERVEILDDINVYYLSWLLRGNSPTFGTDLRTLRDLSDGIDKQWLKASINHRDDVYDACKNVNARELYDRYHSKQLAENYNDVDSFTIPRKYREEFYQLLELIQQDMLGKLERSHIAIECNPSSNYKIGEMDRYDQHPILRFFNYGIDTPYPPHNIAVSINTDDQGVFSTSLEREYSLMALAMERNEIAGHKNSPRAIIEWLDRVREMSLEQRFDINKLKETES